MQFFLHLLNFFLSSLIKNLSINLSLWLIGNVNKCYSFLYIITHNTGIMMFSNLFWQFLMYSNLFFVWFSPLLLRWWWWWSIKEAALAFFKYFFFNSLLGTQVIFLLSQIGIFESFFMTEKFFLAQNYKISLLLLVNQFFPPLFPKEMT